MVDLIATSDTGFSATDDITSDLTPTIEFTVPLPNTITIDWGDGNGPVAYGPNTGGPVQATLVTPYATDGAKTIDVAAVPGPGTQTLTIIVDSTAPTAGDDAAGVAEDSGVTASVLDVHGNDNDNLTAQLDLRAVAVVNQAGTNGGLFSISSAGVVSFDTNGDFEALGDGQSTSTSYTFTVEDEAGNTDTSTLEVTVDGANDAPTAVDTDAEIIRGRSTANVLTTDDLLFEDIDANHGPSDITFTVNGTVAFGVLKLNGVELDVGDSFTQQDIIDGNVIFDHNGQGAESLDLDMLVEDPLSGQQAFTWTITAPFDSKQTGTNGPDSIVANDGESLRANGLKGDDNLVGKDGSDALFGGNGNDNLIGGGGRDQLMGQDGNDNLVGNAGNDRLFGQDGNDTISGDQGHDLINGGAGDDFLNGGTGGDTIIGGSGEDHISGDAGNDVIDAGADDDNAHGGDGRDTISGQGGNDTLTGDGGNDTIRGGAGDDTIGGGTGDDLVYGNAGADVINGDAGEDELRGGGGDDTIYGGSESDLIIGWTGDDILHGQAGDDEIRGGDGSDDLWGQGGADLFVFTRQGGPDLAVDTIHDFELGIDVIDLQAIRNVANVTDIASKYGVSEAAGTTTIDFGWGDQLVLVGIAFDDLTNGDFIFHGP